MTDETKSKYRMFRNFMCNELSITRYDIENWTKEAVAAEVHKLVSGDEIDQLVKDEFALQIRKTIFGSSFSLTPVMKKAVEEILVRELIGKISLNVSENQTTSDNTIEYG